MLRQRGLRRRAQFVEVRVPQRGVEGVRLEVRERLGIGLLQQVVFRLLLLQPGLPRLVIGVDSLQRVKGRLCCGERLLDWRGRLLRPGG